MVPKVGQWVVFFGFIFFAVLACWKEWGLTLKDVGWGMPRLKQLTGGTDEHTPMGSIGRDNVPGRCLRQAAEDWQSTVWYGCFSLWALACRE